MRRAKVYYQTKLAGILSEEDTGYRFVYEIVWIANPPQRASIPTEYT